MPNTQKQNVNMSDLSIAQLEAELNKRRAKIDRLNERKGKLLKRVEELDKEIRSLGGRLAFTLTSTSAGKKKKQGRKHPPGTIKKILDDTHPGVYSLGDVSQILKGAGVILTDQVIAMSLAKNGTFTKAKDKTGAVRYEKHGAQGPLNEAATRVLSAAYVGTKITTIV
jgi:hypothetical protein